MLDGSESRLFRHFAKLVLALIWSILLFSVLLFGTIVNAWKIRSSSGENWAQTNWSTETMI
jgi:hypothetical protein